MRELVLAFFRRSAAKTACRASCFSLVGALVRALGVGVGLPVTASAQAAFTLPSPPFELPFLPTLSGTWTATIGAEGAYKPDFEGANASLLSAVPIIYLRRAGSPDDFRSPRDNASIALIDFGDLRAGPVGKFVPARNQSSNSALYGLGDVNAAFELGGFIEFFPVDWFRLRNETRAGLGGHHGVTSDFSADFVVPVTRALTVSVGPRFTLESSGATSPYFSINEAQAMATGLSVFDAKGGAHSAGVGAQVKYRIDPRWEVHSYVEYDRLLGDAAKSPLVTVRGTPNQTTVGIGASYAFDFRIR
ncbi:MAG TPA: MipA/OmpV family protein [Bradyrhizobium sp.]|nr:MipA/OmpV family protein [Bradyrhizobium sp.]